jgi:predicted metalloprotease
VLRRLVRRLLWCIALFGLFGSVAGCVDVSGDTAETPVPTAAPKRPKATNLFIKGDEKQALLGAVVARCQRSGLGKCSGILGPLPGMYYGRRGNQFWALASFRHPDRGVEGQPLVMRRRAGGGWSVAAETSGTVCEPLPLSMARLWDLKPASGADTCFSAPPPEAEAGPSRDVIHDYEVFERTIADEVNAYWANMIPQAFGVAYQPPEIKGAYTSEQDAPLCGGKPLRTHNASFCRRPDNFIAWDKDGFMLPLFQEFGNVAPAIVVAHEYGHAMQDLLGWKFRYTIHGELNADCLAGAWTKATTNVVQQGFHVDDLDKAVGPLFRFQDPDDSEWFDVDAHGTALERIAAFQHGTAGAVREQCEPTAEHPAGFPNAPDGNADVEGQPAPSSTPPG